MVEALPNLRRFVAQRRGQVGQGQGEGGVRWESKSDLDEGLGASVGGGRR